MSVPVKRRKYGICFHLESALLIIAFSRSFRYSLFKDLGGVLYPLRLFYQGRVRKFLGHPESFAVPSLRGVFYTPHILVSRTFRNFLSCPSPGRSAVRLVLTGCIIATPNFLSSALLIIPDFVENLGKEKGAHFCAPSGKTCKLRTYIRFSKEAL